MSINFTDPRAKAIKPGATRQDYRDRRVPELRLRVSPTGRKVWRLRVSRNGRWESKILGVFQADPKAEIEMSAEDAQFEARKELTLAGRSGSLNQREMVLANMPTLDKWWTKFEADNPRRYTLQTMAGHFYRMDKFISPAFGSKPLHEITNAHLEDLTLDLEKRIGARTANMSRNLVGILLKWADQRGIMPKGWTRPTCPAAQENPVREDNFLPIEKAALFAKTLDELRLKKNNRGPLGDTAADVIWLGILTGARKSNLLQMEWKEIDFGRAVWVIPARKYKTRKRTNAGATIPLIPQALAILGKRRAEDKGSPYVFPSVADPTKPTDNINRSWQWFREKVGIQNVSFHGLRHTLGTWQGQIGVNQRLIGASLGQVDTASTDRYVHADTEIVRGNMSRAIDASFRVIEEPADGICVALSAEQWANIVDILPQGSLKRTLIQAIRPH